MEGAQIRKIGTPGVIFGVWGPGADPQPICSVTYRASSRKEARIFLISVRGPAKSKSPYIDHFLIRGCVLIPPRIGGFLVPFRQFSPNVKGFVKKKKKISGGGSPRGCTFFLPPAGTPRDPGNLSAFLSRSPVFGVKSLKSGAFPVQNRLFRHVCPTFCDRCPDEFRADLSTIKTPETLKTTPRTVFPAVSVDISGGI